MEIKEETLDAILAKLNDLKCLIYYSKDNEDFDKILETVLSLEIEVKKRRLKINNELTWKRR